MIDTVALKNRILNLAIEGKLSEQLESDGNAESIANEIDKQHKERAEKGKEKYTKIRTLDNAIVPFDIPKTWRWFYISDMSIFQEGPGILAKDFRKEGITMSVKNMVKIFNQLQGSHDLYTVFKALTTFIIIYGMLIVKEKTKNAWGCIFIFLFFWNAI